MESQIPGMHYKETRAIERCLVSEILLKTCSDLDEADDSSGLLPASAPSENLDSVLQEVVLPFDLFFSVDDLELDYTNTTELDLSKQAIMTFDYVPKSAVSYFLTLKTLNLSGNEMLSCIGVASCRFLCNLNISNNAIEDVLVVTALPHLVTLNAANNRIQSAEGLQEHASLSSVDLSYNKLRDFKGAFHIFQSMHSLKDLAVDFNPCFLKTPQAFELLAVGLAVECLNGKALEFYPVSLDAVLLSKLKLIGGRGPATEVLDDLSRLGASSSDLGQLAHTLQTHSSLSSILHTIVLILKDNSKNWNKRSK